MIGTPVGSCSNSFPHLWFANDGRRFCDPHVLMKLQSLKGHCAYRSNTVTGDSFVYDRKNNAYSDAAIVVSRYIAT